MRKKLCIHVHLRKKLEENNAGKEEMIIGESYREISKIYRLAREISTDISHRFPLLPSLRLREYPLPLLSRRTALRFA